MALPQSHLRADGGVGRWKAGSHASPESVSETVRNSLTTKSIISSINDSAMRRVLRRKSNSCL
jgi:hypothetical protein